jgi:hypothetical protein
VQVAIVNPKKSMAPLVEPITSVSDHSGINGETRNAPLAAIYSATMNCALCRRRPPEPSVRKAMPEWLEEASQDGANPITEMETSNLYRRQRRRHEWLIKPTRLWK